MAKLFNLARMSTTTTGTGTITLGSAVSGYLTFALAGVANGDVVDYAIKDGSNSEHGTGTYTSSGTTLTRTVTKSTNANAAISLSGTAEVFISPRAETLNDASLFTSGTLPVGRINGGTANQTVQGDGSFITQARKLLNTLTASASATLSDTTSITSSFSNYEIVFENIVPATNAQALVMRVQSGGSFQTTSYRSITQVFNTGYNTNTDTTQFQITRTTNPGVSSTGSGYSGRLTIFNPASTSVTKWISGLGTFIDTITGATASAVQGGDWNSTAAVTGFELRFVSGNITSGVVKVYGLN